MISLSSATRIFIVTGHTDMRKSFNGLYGIVAQQLEKDLVSGHVFVFCNRSRNRVKLLLWDGSGLWVCAKRLEKGRFHWPWTSTEGTNTDTTAAGQSSPAQDSVVITHENLSLLLGGIDLDQSQLRSWYRNDETNT